jgi:hypothetical protein
MMPSTRQLLPGAMPALESPRDLSPRGQLLLAEPQHVRGDDGSRVLLPSSSFTTRNVSHLRSTISAAQVPHDSHPYISGYHSDEVLTATFFATQLQMLERRAPPRPCCWCYCANRRGQSRWGLADFILGTRIGQLLALSVVAVVLVLGGTALMMGLTSGAEGVYDPSDFEQVRCRAQPISPAWAHCAVPMMC